MTDHWRVTPGKQAMSDHGARRRADFAGTTVQFSFDGETIQALDCDTVASALLAAGHRVFNTTPQDGSPRGGFCFVGRCSDCLMIIDGQPGTMACATPVRSGLSVETQRGHGRWSSEGPA